MSRYADIIERLTKAKGPDRVFDLDIDEVLMIDGPNPPYTFSLDAAIDLVERMLPGAFYYIERLPPEGQRVWGSGYLASVEAADELVTVTGTTGPLALLLALFRALSAQEAGS